MIDVFQAIVLGIVQGIAAWIPVSSKTQVILFGKIFFNLNFQTAVSFALIVHVGDLLATFYLFRSELSGFFKMKPNLSDIRDMKNADPERSLFWFVIISVIFSGLVGLPLYLATRKSFSELPGTLFLAVVGGTLVILGILMWITSSKTSGPEKAPRKKRIDLFDTVLTGSAQGFAVIPGISRSGITESTLLLRGYAPEEAIRLSFIMSIPMVILAICTFFFIEGFGTLTVSVALAGIAASFIASSLMMRFMLNIAQKAKFYYFNIAIGLLAMSPFILQLIVS